MNLRLIREPSHRGATLGALYIDGVWQCWTLEDEIRPVKIPGQTCIPAGRYRIDLTWSPRFNRTLPILHEVPGFEGIRIHAGNDKDDTEGCILPGQFRGDAWVGKSRDAMDALMLLLRRARGEVWIAIENPPIASAA